MADKDMTYDHIKLLLETATRSNVLEERFDRHLVETKEDIRELGRKIDKLSLIVTQDKIQQVKDDRETNIKMRTLNGAIAAFVSAVVAYISNHITKG